MIKNKNCFINGNFLIFRADDNGYKHCVTTTDNDDNFIICLSKNTIIPIDIRISIDSYGRYKIPVSDRIKEIFSDNKENNKITELNYQEKIGDVAKFKLN